MMLFSARFGNSLNWIDPVMNPGIKIQEVYASALFLHNIALTIV
jgi:hypothetical protein